MILVVAMCFVFTGNNLAFAQGSSDTMLSTKKLSDGQGKLFQLVETGDRGFYIFDLQTKKCLEYSEDAPSPYLNQNGEMNYPTIDLR